MNETKVINFSLDANALTMNMTLDNAEVFDVIFDALKDYVSQGPSLKVIRACGDVKFDSRGIYTKLISESAQMEEWNLEMKQLISYYRSVSDRYVRPAR